jgi:1-hydroxycarotenoid 3,4-desaturase
VSRVLTGGNGRVAGAELEGGECVPADAVVFNGDAAALAGGLLGEEARRAVPGRVAPPSSLSALTLSARARVSGFPLAYHTVFFGDDYPDEFDSIFSRRAMTQMPTIYVCAQDRAPEARPGDGAERIFCLANAAPGDMSAATVARYRDRVLATLERHGLGLEPADGAMVTTAPPDFGALFPATGGALYGRPTHGWRSSFLRPGSRSRLRGLYLAGGSVHPGPGVPMAALSGRLAAASVRADLGLDGA